MRRRGEPPPLDLRGRPDSPFLEEGEGCRGGSISVVIPVHDEAENIGPFYAELRSVLDRLANRGTAAMTAGSGGVSPCEAVRGGTLREPAGKDARPPLFVEVIFIDDGSRDGTWQEIVKLLKLDSRVLAARLGWRQGKARALATGFRLARGDHIVTMDGDGQDDPNEVPKLLAAALGVPVSSVFGSWSALPQSLSLREARTGREPEQGAVSGEQISSPQPTSPSDEGDGVCPEALPGALTWPTASAGSARGHDLVCGWKQQRCDPWPNVLGSRFFNWLIGWTYGLRLHDHNCGLKCFNAEVVKDLRLFGELHRFITVLAHCQGFRVTEVPVRHRPRKHGRSKYGAFKAVEGMLDLFVVRLMTRFLEKPFHLLGTIGFGIGGLGFAGLAYLAAYWFLGLGAIGGRPLLIYSTVAVLFGMQLIALGITAELINWRMSERQRDLPGKVAEDVNPL